MPGKHVEGVAEQSCRRCKENGAALVVRTEPLCRDCFAKYVTTKVIKRMETFRVRNSSPDQHRKILLPVSFGVSSITLLHILDHHLKTQQTKTGRTGYSLSILFVDTSSVDKASPDPGLLARLQSRYPDHHYATLPLPSIFAHLPSDDSLLSLAPDVDSATTTPESRLANLLTSLPSSTSRTDVLTTLRTRLIVSQAQSTSCEAILWGLSTTALAQRTLSETAKGRGFSLPWQISDGESPFGVAFNYPLRDVLKKELVAFADLVEPGLADLVCETSTGATTASMSSKNTTIDDLMKQYFESVEENFPSIVANVVRTSTKLENKAPSLEDPKCSLCSMPVSGGKFGIHGWGGDQQDGLVTEVDGQAKGLCYGCTRSMPALSAKT